MSLNRLASIPALPGTYVLIMQLFQPATFRVGKTLQGNFPPGGYLYVGSAFGPGGLSARISRHVSLKKRLHWHIDRFLQIGVIRSLYYSTAPQRLECAWVGAFIKSEDFHAPVSCFGASDCRSGCPSHLLHFRHDTDLTPWFGSLRSPLPGKERSVWLCDL